MKKAVAIALALVANYSFGQKILSCSPKVSYWLIQKDQLNYTIKLPPEAIALEHRPDVVAIGDKALQYLVTSEDNFKIKNGDNSDVALLTRFALSEAEYLSGQFSTKLDIKMQVHDLSGGRKALVWSYPMPQHISDEVNNQLYVNVVSGTNIFGLAAPQFKEQDFDYIKKFLTDTIETLAIVKDEKNICK